MKRRAAENRHTPRVFRSLDGQHALGVAGNDLYEERNVSLWTPWRLAQPLLNLSHRALNASFASWFERWHGTPLDGNSRAPEYSGIV